MPLPVSASPERIPIAAAKDFAARHGLHQIIILGWDGKAQHVVTFGRSVTDSDQAAQGGDLLKKTLGWPEKRAFPSRVQKIRDQLKRLRAAAKHYLKVTRTRPDGTELVGYTVPANRNADELREAEKDLIKAIHL